MKIMFTRFIWNFLKAPLLCYKTMAQLKEHSYTKGNKNHTMKAQPKIDMTPMVDLGFLLITFFIFTTSMSDPAVTKLFMPADGAPTTLSKDIALTVLLSGNDSIYYYHGKWDGVVGKNGPGVTNYAVKTGIGKIIREKQKHLLAKRNDLMLLIKPLETASYNNLVNMIDEITINDVKKYAIVDATTEEKNFIEGAGINQPVK